MDTGHTGPQRPICITYTEDTDTPQSYVFDQDVVRLGRSSTNDVQFDPARHPQVSRAHCELRRGPQGWTYHDLESKHGSYYKGRAKVEQPRAIRHGDSFQLGTNGPLFSATFPIPRVTGSEGTHLHFDGFGAEFTYFPLAFSPAFLGRYRRYLRIGAGGFGEVWRAEPPAEVGGAAKAVKLLRPNMLITPANDTAEDLQKVVRRFVREASLMQRLSDANVPGIARVDSWSDRVDSDFIYLVMDFIEGKPLERLLFAYRTVPQALAANIFLQVARTLQAAHNFAWTDEDGTSQQGIIHRDVKPSNIMVERGTGRVFLVDFGIAGIMEGGERLTATNIALGSARFLPLEALLSSAMSPSLDLWGFTVALYVTLTRGAFPYQARTLTELFEALQQGKLTPISFYRGDLDKTLVQTLERALQPEVIKRPQTFDEWIAVLEPLTDPALVPEV